MRLAHAMLDPSKRQPLLAAVMGVCLGDFSRGWFGRLSAGRLAQGMFAPINLAVLAWAPPQTFPQGIQVASKNQLSGHELHVV